MGKERLKKQGFYGKAAWQRLRRMARQRDNYLCQECLKEKRITQAEEVHHVKPVDECPELAMDLSNLVSLCRACHEATKTGGAKAKALPKNVRIIKA